MELNEIGNNIFLIKNAINTEKCKEIVNFIKNNKNIQEYRPVDMKTYNNVECSFIYINNNKNNTYLLELDNYIQNIIGDILSVIKINNKEIPNNLADNGYVLRQIHGGTRLHTDGIFEKNNNNNPRILSIIINLNDEYDGGEFHFPKQDLKVILNVGEAICFPPYWTHPHEVTSVMFGQYRYTINTWLLETTI
jgi:predicted 2-oxoglutarate/Fe(II)-dependent dioxygenase YbiX